MKIVPDAGLLVGVNTAVDVRNLSDLEKRHIPAITAPQTVKIGKAFEVKVQVGSLLPHPSDCGHFIMTMELYADETFLARVDLTPLAVEPSAVFRVRLRQPTKQLRAFCTCNVHGRWVGRKDIDVTEEE